MHRVGSLNYNPVCSGSETVSLETVSLEIHRILFGHHLFYNVQYKKKQTATHNLANIDTGFGDICIIIFV